MNNSFHQVLLQILLPTTIFLKLCASATLQTTDTSFVLENLFHCLDKNLFHGIHDTCNENIAYGVNVATGQMSSILEYLEPDSIQFKKVQGIEKIASNVLKKVRKSCKSSSLYTSIAAPIWKNELTIQKLFPKSTDIELYYMREFLEISSLNESKLLLSGHPNETESNMCLIMLNKNCTIDRECFEKEMDSNNTGYSLTHQVIYWQNFRQMRCSKKNDKLINIIIKKKCRKVYAQHQYIKKHKRFDENLLDLSIEQVAVCGLEGFLEFFKAEYKEKIIQNQMACGCLRFSASESTLLEIPQATCSFDVHLTAVAAVALTVQLKYEVLF